MTAENRGKVARAIKAMFDFDDLLSKGRDAQANATIAKGVNFLKDIEDVEFWLARRHHENAWTLFTMLVSEGLEINGSNVKMDIDGNISNYERSKNG